MNETITLKKFITHPNFSLAIYISVCWILPIYCGGPVTMIACAIVLTACLRDID